MWLIVHEKNEPIRLGITRKPSCERLPNLEGVSYHTISHGLVDFNGQNFHSIDLLLQPYMKESEPKGCIYHTNKDVQPSAKIEWLDATKAF